MSSIKHEDIVSDFLNSEFSTNRELDRAVISKFGSDEEFFNSVFLIVDNGINGGYQGYRFFNETVPFAVTHKKTILAIVKEYADKCSEHGVFMMLTKFNYFSNLTELEIAETIYEENEEEEHYTNVFNALTWYIAEEVCRNFEAWAFSNGHISNNFSYYLNSELCV